MPYCTIMIAAVPLLGLTALTTTNQAWGFWHGWGDQGWNGVGDGDGGLCCNQGDQGPSQGTDAYNAGIADAVYDRQNNLSYHPLGNCLPCHSQEYWNNFRGCNYITIKG